MGWVNDESLVRVDIWKPSGKWYASISLKWDNYGKEKHSEGDELIHEIFQRCLKEQDFRYVGYRATCLEPYHIHSHPISIIIGD